MSTVELQAKACAPGQFIRDDDVCVTAAKEWPTCPRGQFISMTAEGGFQCKAPGTPMDESAIIGNPGHGAVNLMLIIALVFSVAAVCLAVFAQRTYRKATALYRDTVAAYDECMQAKKGE